MAIVRRDFLKAMGLGGSVSGLGSQRAAAGQTPASAGDAPTAMVGGLDLSTLEVIDAHVHPTNRLTLTQSYERQLAGMADMLMPDGEFAGRNELRQRTVQASREHQHALPRRIGYFNYVARNYGVPPTAEGFDSVLAKPIKGDFAGYIKSVLDRERISKCVYQVRRADPNTPTTDFPPDRIVWTLPLMAMFQPDWAKKQNASTLDDAVSAIDRTMETAVANKCIGFKSAIANYRVLGIERVAARDADAALKKLLATRPVGYKNRSGEDVPLYADAAATDALKVYQDYVIKHAYEKAGLMDRVILIHTAAAFNPLHRTQFQDPANLYSVFENDDIRKAGTRFILLHTGFPFYHTTASIVSQFPNVFVDLSFFSKFAGTLEETLRTLVSLAPSRQIMHGSDSNDVPEEIGYCAWNTKQVLSRILNDFKRYYGYSEKDCATIAADVLSGSAKRALKLTT